MRARRLLTDGAVSVIAAILAVDLWFPRMSETTTAIVDRAIAVPPTTAWLLILVCAVVIALIGKLLLERRRAERDVGAMRAMLDETDGQLRRVLQAVPLPLLTWRVADGAILYVNEGFVRAFGRSAEDLLGRKAPELYHDPTDRQRLIEALARDGHLEDYELRVRRGDGTPFWASVTVRRIAVAGEEAVLAAFADVSEQKRTKRALRHERHFVSTILDNTGALIVTADPNGRIVRCNRACENVSGYQFDELTGRFIWDLFAQPDEIESVRAVFVDLNAGHAPIDRETRLRTKSGRERSIAWSLSALHEDSTLEHIVATGIDITERRRAETDLRSAHDKLEARVIERTAELSVANQNLKTEIGERARAEDALRESEERYRNLFESAPIGIYRTSPDGRVLMANPTIIRMMLYDSLDELRQHDTIGSAYVDPADRDRFRGEIEQHGEVRGLETRWRRKDGSAMWVRENARAVPADDGTIAYYEGTVEDITEHRRASEALRENEELLRATVESTADGILVVDGEGKVTHSNSRFAELWRIPSELLETGDDVKLLVFVLDQLQDPEAFLAKVRELYDTANESFDTLHFTDGRCFDRYSCPLLRDHRVVGRVWSFRDVTERNRAEQKLRQSEETYRQMFLDNKAVKLLIDPTDGAIVDANLAAADFHGYPLDRLRQMTLYDLNTASRGDITAEVERARDRQQDHFVFEHRLASGECRTVEVHTGPIAVRGRTLLYSIIHDITDRRVAEEALRDSEERFRTMFETSRDSLFMKNRDRQYVMVNPAMEKLFSRPAAELVGRVDEDLFDGDAASHIRVIDDRVLAGETIEEDHTKSIGGVTRTFHVVKAPMRDDAGAVIGLWGVARDITEHHLAESALRESEERYRRLAEATSEGVLIHDNGTIIDVNRVFADAVLCNVEDLPGQNAFQFVAPESFAVARKNMAEGYEHPYEIVAQRVDGSRFIVELCGKAISYKGKTVRVIRVRYIREFDEDGDSATVVDTEALCESVPVAIMTCRRDDAGHFIVESANPTARRLVDLSESKIIGAGLYDTWPASNDHRDAFDAVLQSGQNFRVERPSIGDAAGYRLTAFRMDHVRIGLFVESTAADLNAGDMPLSDSGATTLPIQIDEEKD